MTPLRLTIIALALAGCTDSASTAAPKLRTISHPIEDTGDTGTTTPVDTSTDTGADTADTGVPVDTASDTATDSGDTDTGGGVDTAPPVDPCEFDPDALLFLGSDFATGSAAPGSTYSTGFGFTGYGRICAIDCERPLTAALYVDERGTIPATMPYDTPGSARVIVRAIGTGERYEAGCNVHTNAGDFGIHIIVDPL